MHADEVHTDAGIVRRLLSAQFPHWSELPIERVPSFGTDNALYRLGSMVVRLPRIEWATRDIEKDARWLEQLRPLVPVEIPELLARGARPVRAIPGPGGSTAGSKVRTRPSGRSPDRTSSLATSAVSLPPCGGSACPIPGRGPG
jgi:phosphotransferase family enzyme